MKINIMKLKLTALLLVLYSGLTAQNKIVLTAPRLDTSSLSNRINLKANTSLNNVNGVLSSTYGGAGIINGILKADGSGVVSAAVAGTDYVAPSSLSGYLPLTAGSGNTITGTLYINSSLLNSNSTYLDIYNNTTDGSDTKITRIGGGGDLSNNRGANIDLRGNEATSAAGSIFLNAGGAGTISANANIGGTSLSMSGEGLFGGAITDGTNKLKVAGSGLFSSSVTASGFSTTSTSGISINSGDGVIDWSSGLRFRVYILGTGYVTPLTLNNTTGAATFSSSVTAGGILKGVGFNQPISVKTANYTLTASDHTVMFNNAAGNLTATLPAGVEGRIYVIGYLDTNNNLTITPNGSETIGGAASFTLQSSTCLGAITLQFLSGNWYIISTNYNASCL